jgi:hypothetical protein
MHLAHFPDGVLPLLQMEGLAAREAASVFGCSMIVEFGCYDGRALEVARFAGTTYLGIDMNQEVITALQGRINAEGMEGVASAIACNALEYREWGKAVVGTKPLHLLAFNLLGTFRDPLALLRSLTEIGGVAVLSVFGGSTRATEIRRAYYTKCGVRCLRQADSSHGGVLFTGDDEFYSQSFSGQGLCALIRESGATVLRSTSNGIGHCVTVLLGNAGALRGSR